MGKLHIFKHTDQPFLNRTEAGTLLGQALQTLKKQNPVVLGIPRGGVVVAQAMSTQLNAELDIILAHKLSAPFNPELAMGSISEDGRIFLNESVTTQIEIPDTYLKQEAARQLAEINRRIQVYREVRKKVELKDRTVIVTDDGVATGSTMQASLWAARQEKPAILIAALPVGPQETLDSLVNDCDELHCLRVPAWFSAVSQFYIEFDQTEEAEVLQILKAAQVPVSSRQ